MQSSSYNHIPRSASSSSYYTRILARSSGRYYTRILYKELWGVADDTNSWGVVVILECLLTRELWSIHTLGCLLGSCEELWLVHWELEILDGELWVVYRELGFLLGKYRELQLMLTRKLWGVMAGTYGVVVDA